MATDATTAPDAPPQTEPVLRTVRFRNYKGLRDVYLELERFTVLIGPNASGKTSILDGIHRLSMTLHIEPTKVFDDQGGAAAAMSRGASRGFQIEAEGANLRHSLALNAVEEKPYRIGAAIRSDSGQPVESWTETVPKRVQVLSPHYWTAAFLQLDSNSIARPSYNSEFISTLRYDGTGTATFLADMLFNNRSKFDEIENIIKTVIPTVRGINLQRAPVLLDELVHPSRDDLAVMRVERREYIGESIFFNMSNIDNMPAAQASEGTLIVLGLLTLLKKTPAGPDIHAVVLLDDLDRGLHPKAQRGLIEILRKVLDQQPNLQIIATSHSPYLLDNLKASEVRLTALRDDGTTACARLDEHPEFEKWKDDFAPGEFWSAVGEEWVTRLRERDKDS